MICSFANVELVDSDAARWYAAACKHYQDKATKILIILDQNSILFGV